MGFFKLLSDVLPILRYSCCTLILYSAFACPSVCLPECPFLGSSCDTDPAWTLMSMSFLTAEMVQCIFNL
jgi:hypothetical protein